MQIASGPILHGRYAVPDRQLRRRLLLQYAVQRRLRCVRRFGNHDGDVHRPCRGHGFGQLRLLSLRRLRELPLELFERQRMHQQRLLRSRFHVQGTKSIRSGMQPRGRIGLSSRFVPSLLDQLLRGRGLLRIGLQRDLLGLLAGAQRVRRR
jgi:hypothetical protein